VALELYVFPPSPRAFKAMVVANYLELDWTLQLLNMPAGAHRTAEYAAMNPNMRMPTLKHDDYVLWESNAICQYLALQKPEAGLLPADERGRLDVTRWQFWDLAHLDAACIPFMFENIVKPALMGINDPDQAALARGAEMFHRALPVLDGHLKGRRYMVGEAPTLADFCLASNLLYGERAEFPLESYGDVQRWRADLAAMPAWQKTAAAMLPA
jgi:glutathione S-transferase